MNIKSNFVKVTAAAALTLTGVAAVNVIKPDQLMLLFKLLLPK